MGLSSLTNRIVYVGDGSSTVFPYAYEFFNPADLQVYLFDTIAGGITPQTLNTNYTISGAVSQQGTYPSGGNVVMNSSFPSNLQLVITRSPTQTQTFTQIQNQPVSGTALTQAFDYQAALVQRLSDQLQRTIQLADGMGFVNGSGFSMALPANICLASSAYAVLQVNSGATGFQLAQIPAFAGIIPVSQGGTGQGNALTPGGVMYALSSSAILSSLAGNPGQVLTSNGASAPTWANGISNPMITWGDMLYAGSSGAAVRIVNGTPGQVPITAGSTVSFGSLPGNGTALKAPTYQIFNSTGTQTGSLFTVTSANATLGATYTNGSTTWVVQNTVAAQTLLFAAASSFVTVGSTLTKVTGTGDATITFTASVATATYTPPASPAPLYLVMKMAGGGGGGGAEITNAGQAGKLSSFGFLTANPGSGGVQGGASANGGAGGSGGFGTANILRVSGQAGGAAIAVNSNGSPGGGSSFFNGGGQNVQFGTGPAGSAAANTGGGGASATSSSQSGGGGGSGECVMHQFNTVQAYPYIVGAGGNGGAAGNFAGGNGAAGIVIVEERYQ